MYIFIYLHLYIYLYIFMVNAYLRIPAERYMGPGLSLTSPDGCKPRDLVGPVVDTWQQGLYLAKIVARIKRYFSKKVFILYFEINIE